MLMCYFPHSSGENTSEALLIAAFCFFLFLPGGREHIPVTALGLLFAIRLTR